MKIFYTIVLCFIAHVNSDSGFYFPDQISSHAESQSEAGVDGTGNVHASSKSQADVSQGHRGDQFGNNYSGKNGNGLIQSQGPYPGGFVGSNGHGAAQGNGPNYQVAGPGYAHQNSNPNFLANAQSQSSAQSGGNGGLSNAQSSSQTQGGLSQSQSTSQSQSSGFQNGYPYSSIAGSTSGSQSNGFGGSSAASAASAASTSFVGGIPVASASAAAAAASAGLGGASSSSANSAATSTGFSGGFPRHPNGWYLAGRMGEGDDKLEGEDSLGENSEDHDGSHEE